MTTPTPGDLSARLLAYATCKAKARDALGVPAGDYVGQEEIDTLCQAAATLSALPAAGGAVGEIREYGPILYTFRPAPPPGTKLYTTPQPSAAECPHCVDGIVPMTEGRPCPRCNGVINDAAVGAQGDGVALMREAGEILAAVGTSGVALPENWRWPLVDELSGQAALLSAAPAAGKGVDAEELRKLIFLWRIREDNGEELTEFDKGYEQASDEHAEQLEAALTRQPVAGDDLWNAVVHYARAHKAVQNNPRMLLSDPSSWNACAASMKELEAARAAMFTIALKPPAAPAATPTDGGEGKA